MANKINYRMIDITSKRVFLELSSPSKYSFAHSYLLAATGQMV